MLLLGGMALFSQSASGQGRAVRTPVRLEVAVEDEADPWSRKDGNGYANDIVRAAFAAANVDAHLVVTPYARCKQMVVQGSVVACFSMSPYPRQSDHVIFAPKPLFVIHSVLIERADSTASAPSAAGKAVAKRVGVVRGYEYPDPVYRFEASGAAVFDYSASEAINLRKLMARRLDAVLVNLDKMKTLPHVLALAGVTGKVRRSMDFGDMRAYLGFSRKHPQSQWALARYTEGLALISENGEADRIRVEWERRVPK
ncbi:MAG: transporter substrate-binding domain-containing protein [Gemmatimonadota bacterium]